MIYNDKQINSAYNDEEVFYCKHCLSLKIRSADQQDYCDDCGSADIESASIFDWEKLYKEKYNKTLI